MLLHDYLIFAYGKGIYEPIKLVINDQEVFADNLHYSLNPNLLTEQTKRCYISGGDAALDCIHRLKTNTNTKSALGFSCS